MTPLIFISFLVSLAIVDFRYSVLRSHYHAEPPPSEGGDGDPHQTATSKSRTPPWLHRLLFKYRPYRYVPVSRATTGAGSQEMKADGEGRSVEEKSHGLWGTYYHTKQRKLMKMEAADAFEIRSTVLVVLGVLSVCLLWSLWRVSSWAVYAVMSRF